MPFYIKIVPEVDQFPFTVCPIKLPVYFSHRVNREDSPIIILDTKLVADFVLHACCFFIEVNRYVLKSTIRANKSLTQESRAAKS